MRFPTTIHVLLIVGLLAALIPPASATGQSQRNAAAAVAAAIRYSELEADGQFETLYRYLHPDAQEIVPESAVVGWYSTDFATQQPHPISDIIDGRFVSWTWEVTGQTYGNTAEINFIQPFGPSGAQDYRQETVHLVEENGDWLWFFGRSREFVDEQIARFPPSDESTSTATQTNADSDDRSEGNVRDDDESDQQDKRDEALARIDELRDANNESSLSNDDRQRESTSNRASDSCTWVELYPGYPGYRGNITGVMPHWGGTGDYECLGVLERQDRSFDIEREDRLNLEAARQLGINGEPHEWTWENWMLIEAQRGLVLQCYTCLMFDSTLEPLNPQVTPAANDPRILSGMVGTGTALVWIAGVLERSLYDIERNYQDDYLLRAAAYLWSGTPILNAVELLDTYIEIIDNLFTLGGSFIDGQKATRIAVHDWGGYVLVPSGTSPPDQVFLMTTPFFMAASHSPFPDYYLSIINQQVDGWEMHRATGGTLTLAEYMRQELPDW